jgi:glycosyltransferase involved in cell wall biosynthesis
MVEVVRQSPLLGHCDVHCIPHGLDTTVFTPSPKVEARERLGLPPGARIVLFSSFDPLLPRKGGVYLFEALQRLTARGMKDLLLVTVGCDRHAMGDAYGGPVHNLGRIRDERKMAACYSAADVYVGPSLAETFGLVFTEAMACATPVVAFAGTGASEVVRHMKTGYLARYQDSEDVAQGIQWLLNDGDLRRTCGREGREVVEQEYTLELQARRQLELYEHVIGAFGRENPGRRS